MFRRNDCFGRLGGDEFAVLMPVASIAEAREIAVRLHDRLTSALAGKGYSVTCSMGALIVPAEGRAPLAELMREADRLMYAVKHGGKNDVRFAVARGEGGVAEGLWAEPGGFAGRRVSEATG